MSALDTFLLVWITFLGGCVGSFLNVVVYRLPRGENLVHPGSRCPACGHAIRLWHNIPVFGWLMLRGRCFDCQARISPRYPVVEALVATVFLLLAVTGPLAPSLVQPLLEEHQTEWNILRWGLYAYCLVFLCYLLALAFMNLDAAQASVRTAASRHPAEPLRRPWRSLFVITLLGLTLPWLAKTIMHGPTADTALVVVWPGLTATDLLNYHPIHSLFGFAAALLTTAVAWILAGQRSRQSPSLWFSLAGLLLIGTYLTLPGLIEILAAATLVDLLARTFRRKTAQPAGAPLSAFLFALSLLWLVGFRPGGPLRPESLPGFSMTRHGALAAILLITWATLLVRHSRLEPGNGKVSQEGTADKRR